LGFFIPITPVTPLLRFGHSVYVKNSQRMIRQEAIYHVKIGAAQISAEQFIDLVKPRWRGIFKYSPANNS
jgi:hypothetical protein